MKNSTIKTIVLGAALAMGATGFAQAQAQTQTQTQTKTPEVKTAQSVQSSENKGYDPFGDLYRHR